VLATFASFLSAFGLQGPVAVRADESSEPFSGVYVEDAVATPAAAGEVSFVGFRIDNFSGRNLQLMGVNSDAAETTLVLVRRGGTGGRIANTVLVMQDETLDLRTSHMWVELRGLKSEVREGDLVPLELIFARGRVPAQAHAHAGAMSGDR
jgi:copper(I)-binding protein